MTIRAEWERIWIGDQEVGGTFRSSSLARLQPRLSHTARAWPYIRLQGLRPVRLQFKAQGPKSFAVPATADRAQASIARLEQAEASQGHVQAIVR
jgi:hypothetical protein